MFPVFAHGLVTAHASLVEMTKLWEPHLNEPSARQFILQSLADLREHYELLGLHVAPSICSTFRIALEHDKVKLTKESVEAHVASIYAAATAEMQRQRFFRLPPESVALYQGKQAFGEHVDAAFPSAAYDIEESGNCLALDRGTASVFHLMRVIEIGLRALGDSLGVHFAGTKDWQAIINDTRGAINRRQPPFSKEDLELHQGALAHIETIKLAWRNPVIHVRGKYTPEEATEVRDATRGLMRHLATFLSETTPSPEGSV